MSTGNNKRIVAASILGLMVLGAPVAQVSAASLVGPDRAVSYADLDLNTVAGAEKLYVRIQQAAAQICPQAQSQPLVEYVAAVRCRNEVVAHAVEHLSSPQVTAVFAARAHRGLLIDNTGGPDLTADGPTLVAEKPDGKQGWLVHRPDLHPDLTAAL